MDLALHTTPQRDIMHCNLQSANCNQQQAEPMSSDDPGNNQRIEKLLQKVRRLRQNTEIWEGVSRLGRIWITPDHQPHYRPYLILIAAKDRAVLHSHVVAQAPTADQIFEELLNAMLHPIWGAGKARRPRVIQLDHPEHVAALAPRLSELGVSCQHHTPLSAANTALKALERSMNRGSKPLPGLLTIPTVTPAQLGNLFQLTADFHRATPWRWLSDYHSMEIRYPLDAAPRYAVVMGSGGEVFGLAVYDTLPDLQRIFEPQLSHRHVASKTSWLVLFFEIAIAMSFDDLDAITQYGWPIPNESAYPVFGRTTKNAEIGLPTAADLAWMAAALAGILAYLPKHRQFARSSDRTITITTPEGEAQLRLKWPAVKRGW